MTPGDRSADRSDEEALREHLAELETVLSRLRSDLSEESRTRNRVPRPPSPTELLRFTERYTLPALIALLEATIRSLELLRATLRVADPDRRLDAAGDGSHGRLADVRDGTTAGVRRTLSELRTALSETDLPQEATSRELLEDARELSAEIDDLLAGDREATPTGGTHGSDRSNDGDGEDGFASTDAGRAGRNKGISIDVHDPDAPDASGDRSSTLDAEEETDEGEDSAPEIDVDAELASIKQELDEDDEKGTENDDERARDGDAASDDSDGRDESNDPNDADDGIGESADSTDSDDIAGSDDIADPNDADDSDEPVD